MEVKTRKIKDLRKKNSGNTNPRPEYLKEKARIQMLTNNPMKNPEYAKKHSKRMKGRVVSPGTLFQKGNKLGKGNKGKKHSDLQNTVHSMTMLGHTNSDTQKDKATINALVNNPMKNPDVVKTKIQNQKLKRKEETKKKLSHHAKTHPNVIRTQFKKKEVTNE